MKKLIALTLLLPFITLAADSVDITSVSVSGSTATINGTASDAVEVSVDSTVVGTSAVSPFSVVKSGLNVGTHTASAVVGSASDSQSFFVADLGGGGLSPCQIERKCSDHGKTAPFIPSQIIKVGMATENNLAKDQTVVTIFNLFELITKGLI